MFFQQGSSNGASERFSRMNISVRVTQGSCFCLVILTRTCALPVAVGLADCRLLIAGVLFPCRSEFIGELFFCRPDFCKFCPISAKLTASAGKQTGIRGNFSLIVSGKRTCKAFSGRLIAWNNELAGNPSPDCRFCFADCGFLNTASGCDRMQLLLPLAKPIAHRRLPAADP